ncbi:MAG: phosphate starvation-inducible protein PsiF [Burkholderiales bacterium]|nr:phosphate starvation-inducible protein PsiF [Burkholderiales bacterium]
MKKLLIALSLALAATGAYAKDEKAATPQQSKMAGCNKEAKDMKGDERKAFMKSCLSNKPAAEAKAESKKALTPQQQKMQDCNKEAKAKEMKGADRKKFMSGCLKGDAKPAEAKAATPAVPATSATPAKPADKK